MTTSRFHSAIIHPMKTLALLFLHILTCAAFAGDEPPATPAQKDARKLLQEGLFEEEANRDLDKASAAYEGVIKQYNDQRNIAATAIFRMAEIRTKQGKKEEATKLFQQLLKEFPDQEPLMKVARERLAVDNPEIHREAASKAVEEWLKLVDAREYEKSWETAAPYFKGKITQDDWVKMVAGIRRSFGELKKRGFVSANYHTIVPGAPKGEYFVMQFQSIFDDKEYTETITPMKTPEGDWRVSGYVMTPLAAGNTQQNGQDTSVGPQGRIFITGRIQQQGEMKIDPDEKLTLSKLIFRAGGFTDRANKRQIKLIRKNAGGELQTTIINLEDVLIGGQLDKDPVVQAGDTVIVPEKFVNF